MKTLLSTGFLALTLALSPYAHAEEGTRGGGNAIRCDDGKLYAWDYVNAQLDRMPLDPTLAQAPSAAEILRILGDRLDKVRPNMAAALRDFGRFNEDLLNEKTNRVWIPGRNPLIEIGGEDRLRIPKHCVSAADENFRLYQAVVRTQPGKILYAYDPTLTRELEQNSPVQLSYLYVHEWLRDYTDNANSLTLVNQLLHSTAWQKQGCLALGRTLKGLGLKIPDDNMTCYDYNGTYASYDHGIGCNLRATIRLNSAGKLSITEKCTDHRDRVTVANFRCDRLSGRCDFADRKAPESCVAAELEEGGDIVVHDECLGRRWNYYKQ